MQVQEVFFYFGHGRVRLFGELEDKFCAVLRGSGFDNCGLDLIVWGVGRQILCSSEGLGF